MSTIAFYLVGEGEIIIDIPYYCYKLLVPASHKELSYFGGIWRQSNITFIKVHIIWKQTYMHITTIRGYYSEKICKVDRDYKGDKRSIPAIRVGFTEEVKKNITVIFMNIGPQHNNVYI